MYVFVYIIYVYMGKRGGRSIGLSQDLHTSALTVWEDCCIFSQLSTLFFNFPSDSIPAMEFKILLFLFFSKKGRENRMQDLAHGSMDPQEPHEWSAEQVATFVRSLGTAECFQSAGHQVLQLGTLDQKRKENVKWKVKKNGSIVRFIQRRSTSFPL